MPSALRPYVTAGIALVGASVISVTPISPAQIMSANSDLRVSSVSVDLVADVTSCAGAGSTSDLCTTSFPSFMADGTPSAFQAVADTAGSSVFNIPANLLIALANVPYNLLTALGSGDDGTGNPLNLGSEPNSGFSFTPSYNNVLFQQPNGHVVGLAADLNYAGNIWVYSPTNVLGTDPGDIPRYQALVNASIPFPELSVGLGNIFAAIAAALLPMNVGCTGTGLGACPNIGGILGNSLNFSNVLALFSPQGYTFPVTRDPITCNTTGQCDILDPAGPETPQSQQNVKLDLLAPFTNFYNSLTVTPDFTRIKFPTFDMAIQTLTSVINGFVNFLNPFVLGTQCGVCALVVPNPNNLPVPGPTNLGTGPILGIPTGSTSSVSTLDATSGDDPSTNEDAPAVAGTDGGSTALATASRFAASTDVVETAKPTDETSAPADTTTETDTTDETTGTTTADTDGSTSTTTASDKTTATSSTTTGTDTAGTDTSTGTTKTGTTKTGTTKTGSDKTSSTTTGTAKTTGTGSTGSSSTAGTGSSTAGSEKTTGTSSTAGGDQTGGKHRKAAGGEGDSGKGGESGSGSGSE